MKKIFINEVIKYAVIVGISVTFLIWLIASFVTMKQFESIFRGYIASSINLINYDTEEHKQVLKEYKKVMIGSASNIALLLEADKSYITNQAKLDELRNTLALEEIIVTDANKQIMAISSFKKGIAYPCAFLDNFTLDKHTKIKYMNPVFCERYFEVMQYTGAALPDDNGIIIIGKKINEGLFFTRKGEFANLSSIYYISKDSSIIIIDRETNEIVSYKDKHRIGKNISSLGIDIDKLQASSDIKLINFDNRKAYALLQNQGEYTYIALAYQKNVFFEIYMYIIIVICIIVLMIFLMYKFMLNTIDAEVIRGIAYIISCLNSINENKLDTVVELDTCEEFSSLSNSINAMVTRLRNLVIRKEELINKNKLLSDSKSNFLAVMSHEIRTPLNVIIGIAQLGMYSNLDINTKKNYFADINDASIHLLGLLNDILEMSKIEAGKVDIVNSPFNIEENIMQLKLLISTKIQEQSLNLIIETKDIEEAVINGDKLRLNQVLLNLLSNSIKFTEQNKNIALSVTALDKTDKNITIRFMVSDEGIGMSKEKLDSIFKPFEQVDTSISRSFGGSGLGLTISQNIIEMMGSKINVESELGKGSSFWFDITFDYGVLQNLDNKETLLEDNSLSEYRVLIVDDAELNRKVLCAFLERTGIKIEEAENGEEAVEKYTVNHIGYYDIILMDIHMPNMNGYEATNAIRHSDKMDALTIPIIAVTADAFKETEEKVMQSGMTGFITKPINFVKLSSILKKTLSNKINLNEKIMVWTKLNDFN